MAKARAIIESRTPTQIGDNSVFSEVQRLLNNFGHEGPDADGNMHLSFTSEPKRIIGIAALLQLALTNGREGSPTLETGQIKNKLIRTNSSDLAPATMELIFPKEGSPTKHILKERIGEYKTFLQYFIAKPDAEGVITQGKHQYYRVTANTPAEYQFAKMGLNALGTAHGFGQTICYQPEHRDLAEEVSGYPVTMIVDANAAEKMLEAEFASEKKVHFTI